MQPRWELAGGDGSVFVAANKPTMPVPAGALGWIPINGTRDIPWAHAISCEEVLGKGSNDGFHPDRRVIVRRTTADGHHIHSLHPSECDDDIEVRCP